MVKRSWPRAPETVAAQKAAIKIIFERFIFTIIFVVKNYLTKLCLLQACAVKTL